MAGPITKIYFNYKKSKIDKFYKEYLINEVKFKFFTNI